MGLLMTQEGQTHKEKLIDRRKKNQNKIKKVKDTKTKNNKIK